MNPSPDKIDHLEFSWDSEAVESKKINKIQKVTSITGYDLEDYFKFLEDVLPDPYIYKKVQLPVDKVFEL